jgi:S1-C subfamily serine protease
VSRGNVSRIISGTHGTRYLQHTAPTNPGNSGGPVYDQAGNVIGVNSMKALTLVPTISGGHLAAGRVASGEGIAVAVDVAEILSALEQLQVPYAMIGNYSDMSMPMTLVAATVAMILAAAGIVVLTSSGRDWVFRRTIPIKIRDPNARGGKIRVINGALAGTELSISAKVILGRDPTQAQMVFPQDDTAVSRRHCEIGFNTGVGQFEVRDLKSRNGTFIAGDAGPPRRLAPEVVERVAPGHSVLVGSSRNRLALELI